MAPTLHELCTSLAPLLGTWRGSGAGDYPTIEPFAYVEELTFTNWGKPFVAMVQRTRDATTDEPLHVETGYLRPQPGGVVELVVAQPSGILESLEGPLLVTPDGLDLETIEGRPFLTVNGIQTLSYDYLNMVGELAELRAMGVSRFRLSPHSCDMVEVAAIFRAALDERIDAAEGAARLDALKLPAPFSNGFYYGKPGHLWNAPAPVAGAE